ncbi:hypothetical protein BJ741DRAFT_118053 [Chytriomyces cf. hyalinus JEL632]|nr:hypothetical protein BJ741DRAFT_118053 [Chytriomyces cf. hyalinus JEL632]
MDFKAIESRLETVQAELDALKRAAQDRNSAQVRARIASFALAVSALTSHTDSPSPRVMSTSESVSPNTDEAISHNESSLAALSPLIALTHALEANAESAQSNAQTIRADNVSLDDLRRIRRANEDSAIALHDAQTHANLLRFVEMRTWLDWSHSNIALSIARVDVALFSQVADVKSSIASAHLGSASNPVCKLLHFQYFLRNSVVTSILSLQLKLRSPPTSPNAAIPPPSNAELASMKYKAMARMVENMTAVVFLLFYVYRDLNATAAILQGLSDPRLARLDTMWNLVAPKCLQSLENLKDMTGFGMPTPSSPSSAISTSASESISLVVELLQHHYRGDLCITVIPNMTPFIQELDHLKREYTIDDTYSSSTTLPILSDVGTKALQELLHVVSLCRGLPIAEAVDSILDGPFSAPNNPPPHVAPPNLLSTISPKFLQPTSQLAIGAASNLKYGTPDIGPGVTPMPWDAAPTGLILDDLCGLPLGDLKCLHWVLTRTNLSELELWDASFAILAKLKGEVGFVEPARIIPVASVKQVTEDDEVKALILQIAEDKSLDLDLEEWSDRGEDNDDEAAESALKVAGDVLKAALAAAGGNAPPIADVPSSVVGSENHQLVEADENEPRDASHDDEEYQARLNALSALFPKTPDENL